MNTLHKVFMSLEPLDGWLLAAYHLCDSMPLLAE